LDKQNILIPGAGGAAGVGAIKSLRMYNFAHNIITTDANPLSAGFYLADRGYVLPFADASTFLDEALNIIEAENIGIIFPTSGFDIIPYSKNKKKLSDIGVTTVVSDYECLNTCLDKYRFYKTLSNKFDLPFTTKNPDQIDSFPCIVKPIFGKGSRDVFICTNREELDDVLEKHENMIIQEYLPNKEYTIDVMSDLDGNPIVAIPRERVEIKAGISSKGKVVLDENIQEECLEVAEFLNLKGPSCMQMKVDSNGEPKIIEVNPRMGGATIMATYAGANFAEMILKMVNEEDILIPKLKEISMIRYYEEIILDENKNVVNL
jgi:carbamoyl-phosphate synthase large subunit